MLILIMIMIIHEHLHLHLAEEDCDQESSAGRVGVGGQQKREPGQVKNDKSHDFVEKHKRESHS